MGWFLQAITTKYASFSGRARRREYWYFQLFAFLIGIIIMVPGAMIVGLGDPTRVSSQVGYEVLDGVSAVLTLAFFIPESRCRCDDCTTLGKAVGCI